MKLSINKHTLSYHHRPASTPPGCALRADRNEILWKTFWWSSIHDRYSCYHRYCSRRLSTFLPLYIHNQKKYCLQNYIALTTFARGVKTTNTLTWHSPSTQNILFQFNLIFFTIITYDHLIQITFITDTACTVQQSERVYTLFKHVQHINTQEVTACIRI